MKPKELFFAGCLLLALFFRLARVDAQSATAVGDPGHPEGLGAAITAAYAKGYRTIVVNPGTYVMPQTNEPVCTMQGWNDAIVAAYEVYIVYTNTDAPHPSNIFVLNNCKDVTFEGATITQTRMSCYQGHVAAIGPTAPNGDETLEIQFDAGYPLPPTDRDVWLNGVDSKTLFYKTGSHDYYHCHLTAEGGELYNVDFNEQTVPMQPGDIVYGRNQLLSEPTKVELLGCSHCTVKDTTFLNNGFASLFEHECPGQNQILNDTWAPGDPPFPGANAPVFSCAADGFHSVDSQTGPDIENCAFKGLLQDDCIAIHGNYEDVLAVNGGS